MRLCELWFRVFVIDSHLTAFKRREDVVRDILSRTNFTKKKNLLAGLLMCCIFLAIF